MKKKTLQYGLLALIIFGSVVVVGTVAYLFVQTNEVDNPFVFVGKGNGIYAVITEEDWDGYIINPEYKPGEEGIEELIFDTGKYTGIDDPRLGINIGKKMIQGMNIPKTPILTNRSKSDESGSGPSIFAGIKITFIKGQDTTGNLIEEEEYNKNFLGGAEGEKPFISLENLTANGEWIADEGNTEVTKIYYWAMSEGDTIKFKPLMKDEATAPLFTALEISPDLTSVVANTVTEWNGFNIKIEGAVCSAEDISDEDAKQELRGLLTMDR